MTYIPIPPKSKQTGGYIPVSQVATVEKKETRTLRQFMDLSDYYAPKEGEGQYNISLTKNLKGIEVTDTTIKGPVNRQIVWNKELSDEGKKLHQDLLKQRLDAQKAGAKKIKEQQTVLGGLKSLAPTLEDWQALRNPADLQQIAIDVGQSIAQSFLATGKLISEMEKDTIVEAAKKGEGPVKYFKRVAAETYTPTGEIEKKIFGTDQPVSFKTIGEEMLMVGGEDFKEKWGSYAIPIGLLIGALDITPIGFGDDIVKVARAVSKIEDTAQIAKQLSKVVKGTEEEIQFLAKSLQFATNADEIVDVIKTAGSAKGIKALEAAPKAIPKELEPLAEEAIPIHLRKETIEAMTKAYKARNPVIMNRPIALIKDEGKLSILEGEHRFFAAKQAGVEPPMVVLTRKATDNLNAPEIDALARKMFKSNTKELTDFYTQATKGVTEVTAIPRKTKLAQVAQDEALARHVQPTRPSKKLPAKKVGEAKASKFSDSYTKSYNESPELSRGKKFKDVETKLNPTELNAGNLGLYKNFKKSASDSWLKVREFIQDDMIRVRRLLEDPNVKVSEATNIYEKEVVYHGRVASRLEEAKNIVTKVDKDVVATAKRLGVDDISIQNDINRYLWSKHAPERNLALGDGAAGITTSEAKAISAELKALPHYEDIVRLSNDIANLNSKTLDVLKESGVIGSDLYVLLRTKYKNHVPLQRVFEETENIREVMTGRGFDVRGTGIIKARGSKREVADIVTNVVSNYEQAIIRAEKNIVDNSTLKFVRENKVALKGVIEEIKPRAIGQTFEGKILTERITDPSVLALRESGKAIYLKIYDKHLAAALKGVSRHKVEGLLRFVKTVTRFYSSLATRFNPEFAFPNKVRDLQEVMVYLSAKKDVGFKSAAKVLKRDAGSLKDILDNIRGVDSDGAKLYRQMVADGGTTGGLGLSTRMQVELDITKIRELNRSNPKKAAEQILKKVNDWNTLFEDSTRLSVYKEGLDRGLTRQRSAVLAKEASVNFNKFGTAGPVINSLYMFANASIQGSAKMLGAMKNPKVAATVTLAVGTATFGVNQWNDSVDPNWREKVSKWDRMNGLPIVLPTSDGIRYFVIPVSWGIKPIKVMMDAAYDTMAGEGDSLMGNMGTIVASVVEGYNPVGGSDIVSAAVPSILDLPVEMARNKAWYGNKIKPDWDLNAPASIQYYDSLEETAIGRASIAMTGELSGAGIEISPEDVDYAYKQLVGGAGRFVSKTLNTLTSIGKGEVPEAREIPFVSRFLRERTEEEVGSGSAKAEDVRKVLQDQSRTRFEQSQEAEDIYDELKKIDKEEAKKRFDVLIKEKPTIAQKINQIIKEEQLGLTYIDRLILQLGVENGERAKFIFSELNKLKTKEAKKKYYQDLIDKRIISKRVGDQINYLLNQ